MRRTVFAAAALAFLIGSPALAQVYYREGPPVYRERPYRGAPPDYYDRRGYDEDEYRGPRRGYGYGEPYRGRRARIGGICVTSRGNCEAPGRAPVNTPCRCFIPGFGEKRGAIGY
jgi:hypothetical protein